MVGKGRWCCTFALGENTRRGEKAPTKGFYTFRHSAHSPIFEEPATALHILRADVLAGLSNLADNN